MKAKAIITLSVVIIGLVIADSSLSTKYSESEQIVISVESLVEELTIDDKIARAELIVLGNVKSNLPSKWKYENEKEIKNAVPQEVFDAEGLFTDSIIQISQAFKGDRKEPIIRVRSFIGEIDQIRWENSSEPLFEKGETYILFLQKDTGPTAKVDPGNFISINSVNAVYKVVGGRAISADEEWLLEDLIAYIKKSLSGETPVPVESLPLPTETILPPTDSPTESPVLTDTPTAAP